MYRIDMEEIYFAHKKKINLYYVLWESKGLVQWIAVSLFLHTVISLGISRISEIPALQAHSTLQQRDSQKC
jgi:hypothetical protein